MGMSSLFYDVSCKYLPSVFPKRLSGLKKCKRKIRTTKKWKFY